jgi:cytochrome c oxidase assembly protein subunit 15
MSKKRYTTTMGKRVQQWLLLCMALVAIIVLIGGITRLTGSGLSMVDWKPILGSIPPLSSDDWAMAFNAYKQSPEYIKINAGMTLNEFKFIFFWEYLHRMIGRCIGLIAVVPFLYFLVKKQLSATFARRWLIIISLIGCQGLMGWFMVKSGLVNNPHVSHFRLAAHLSLAFLIFSLILKDYLRIVFPIKSKPSGLIWAVTGVLGLQIVYGAFTAGLHAGKYYTTYFCYPVAHSITFSTTPSPFNGCTAGWPSLWWWGPFWCGNSAKNLRISNTNTRAYCSLFVLGFSFYWALQHW